MADEQLICTVTLTNGNATVTGTGNSWLTTVDVNDVLMKNADGEPTYHIASVTNNNELELTSTYAGSTETTEVIIQRSFTTNDHLARLMAGDQGVAEILTNEVIDVIDSDFCNKNTSFTMANGKYIAVDTLKARDSGGLVLQDDSGNDGLQITDGGIPDAFNNYITSLQNTADAGAGIVGNYYSFDGVDDYGQSDSITLPSDYPFSFSCYFRTKTSGDNKVLLFFGSGSSFDSYLDILINASGQIVVQARNTTLYQDKSSDTYNDDNWHFVVGVFLDASTRLVYVDGKLVITSAANSVACPTADRFAVGYLGRSSPTYYFRGQIATARFYNTALTADEVKALYSGAPVPDKYVGASQTALTSGTLTVGYEYIIDTYVSGDDFTNVGASSNVSGEVFTATGTTPTDWSNGSSLRHIGNVLNLNKSKTTDTWYDESGNNLDATMHGATLVSNNKYGYFERGLITDGDIKQEVHTSDVSNPPTDAELDALFTSPASKGEGWTALVADSNSDNLYIIISDGTYWYSFAGTKAV